MILPFAYTAPRLTMSQQALSCATRSARGLKTQRTAPGRRQIEREEPIRERADHVHRAADDQRRAFVAGLDAGFELEFLDQPADIGGVDLRQRTEARALHVAGGVVHFAGRALGARVVAGHHHRGDEQRQSNQPPLERDGKTRPRCIRPPARGPNVRHTFGGDPQGRRGARRKASASAKPGNGKFHGQAAAAVCASDVPVMNSWKHAAPSESAALMSFESPRKRSELMHTDGNRAVN